MKVKPSSDWVIGKQDIKTEKCIEGFHYSGFKNLEKQINFAV